MREEFRRKMREDIDLLRSLVAALGDLHEQAEEAFYDMELAVEEGGEFAPMMAIGHRIRKAREECRAFDAYFEEKYGREKSDEKKVF